MDTALTLTITDPVMLKIIDPLDAQMCESAIVRESQKFVVVGWNCQVLLLTEQKRGYLPLNCGNEIIIHHCRNCNDRSEGIKELPSHTRDSSLTPPHQSCFLVAMRISACSRHFKTAAITNLIFYNPLFDSAADNRGFGSALTTGFGYISQLARRQVPLLGQLLDVSDGR